MLSTLKIFLNLAFNKRGKILNYSLENLNFLFLLRYLIILLIGFHIVEKRNILSTLFFIKIALLNLFYDLFTSKNKEVYLVTKTEENSIKNSSFSFRSKPNELITFNKTDEIIFLNDRLKIVDLNPSSIKFIDWNIFSENENFIMLDHFNSKMKKNFYQHFKWLLEYKSNISLLVESFDTIHFQFLKSKKSTPLILTFKPKYSNSNGLFCGITVIIQICKIKQQTNWLSNEMKISHELKTHLCTLKSVIETTQEYFLLLSNYQKKLFFIIIKNEIEYLKRLIKSLSILNNLNSQVFQINKLNFTLNYVAQSYSVLLKSKNLYLGVELCKKNTCIIWNTDSAIQVLSNLINNSLKFNYHGGKIFLRSFEIKKKNQQHYLRIEIIDTGIGIPTKYKDLLLTSNLPKPNFHYNSLRSNGIGLEFIKRLLINNKSKLYIATKSYVGTIFWFDLILL